MLKATRWCVCLPLLCLTWKFPKPMFVIIRTYFILSSLHEKGLLTLTNDLTEISDTHIYESAPVPEVSHQHILVAPDWEVTCSVFCVHGRATAQTPESEVPDLCSHVVSISTSCSCHLSSSAWVEAAGGGVEWWWPCEIQADAATAGSIQGTKKMEAYWTLWAEFDEIK